MTKGHGALLEEANASIETLPPEQALRLLGNDAVVFVEMPAPKKA